MSFYSCTLGVRVYCRGMEENNNNPTETTEETMSTTADRLDNVRETYAHAIGEVVNTANGPVRLDYFGLRVGKVVAVVFIDTPHAYGHIEMHLDEFLAAYY